jgi:hypothetical protein
VLVKYFELPARSRFLTSFGMTKLSKIPPPLIRMTN